MAADYHGTLQGEDMPPIEMVDYLPSDKRKYDTQYRDRLRLILEKGELLETQQGVRALTYMAPPPMRFDFRNGVPLITERKIPFWRAAIGELLAFISGARTQSQLEKFGCSWWNSWVTSEKCAKRDLEQGDLGPGSYGAAFHDFPTADGGSFDQITHLIEQVRELPHLRTHFVSPWIPQYIGRGKGKKQRVVVAPCHGWMHVRILPGRRLVLHMFQRSADFPVGVPANMIQYSAFAFALAYVTGTTPDSFIHSFSDAHIYENQISDVLEMLDRPKRLLPLLNLNVAHESIFDFRPTDFEISEYDANPPIKNIPVAV
jgi:thymidylate synthase